MVYIDRNRPSNAAPMAGKDSNTPYFKKVRFLKGTPQLRRSPDHMIPAKAPIGVKKAPMFEPITVAYTAGRGAFPHSNTEE